MKFLYEAGRKAVERQRQHPAFEELRQQYVMSQLEIERLNKEIQDISA